MMKYFLAIALIAAVASAAVRPTPVSAEIAEIQEIIAAIQSPSTDPATAAALEEMLLDALGIKPEPIAVGPAIIGNPLEGIAVGPAIIENPLEGIAVGPALIDFPLPDDGAVSAPVVAPSPVEIIDGSDADVSASAPLVQIILNINQAAQSSPIPVAPVVNPEPVADAGPKPIGRPTPIATLPIVEAPPVNPIAVNPIGVGGPQPAPINPIAVNPIGVGGPQPAPVNPIAVNPIGVAPVEPVQIGVPIIPEAAVILPEELN